MDTNYSKQIVLLCGFKNNIKCINENADVLLKYILSFMSVAVNIVTKLRNNMYKKQKNDYYTLNSNNNYQSKN